MEEIQCKQDRSIMLQHQLTLMTMLASRGDGFADNKMNLMITSPYDTSLHYQLGSLTNSRYFCVFTQFGNFFREDHVWEWLR